MDNPGRAPDYVELGEEEASRLIGTVEDGAFRMLGRVLVFLMVIVAVVVIAVVWWRL